MTTNTTKSRAWLLDFGSGLQAAVGYNEMWQILMSPKLFKIPCTPEYCDQVLIFQDRILPVLDMSYLLKGKKSIKHDIIGIALYQDQPNHPINYTGLHLASIPKSIYVSDDQMCDLPKEQQCWAPFTLSCFSHDNQAIPIINLTYIFSLEFHCLQFGWKTSSI
jgi:chemotaxis signal transduction protein